MNLGRFTRRQTLASVAAAALPIRAPAQTSGGASPSPPPAPPPHPFRLWYREPAREWVQALPVGNGRLGAMVFGGVATERLQLNEDTFYSGGPYDTVNPQALGALPEIRRLIFEEKWAEAQKLGDEKLLGKPAKLMAYQPLGDLVMLFPGMDNSRDYVRELDLDEAVARTRFKLGQRQHTREVFSSPVDQVLVVRLEAGGGGRITFDFGLSTPQNAELEVDGADTVVCRGVGPTHQGIEGRVRFETRVKILNKGGTVQVREGGAYIQGADEVVLLVAAATSYRSFDDVSGDPSAVTRAQIEQAAAKPYERLLADHLAEHRRLFRRVEVDLGTSPAAALPTDERIRTSAQHADPALAALYLQYGRYLLISSSRPGTQPANLQGIWNDKINPSWQSKWTLNINAEMNYWPAEPGALSECVEPLIRMVRELSVTGAGVARRMYGARGWMVHNNTDIWRMAAPVDGVVWSLWPTGGAWLCQHLWDHWDYGRDRAYLAEVYPILKGCAQFFLDTLVEDPKTKKLVTNPSMSPENRHHGGNSLAAAPAMDNQLLRDLFSQVAEASEILKLDAAFRRQVRATRARLPEDRIGKAGQLQEWMEDWDMEAPDIHHRHVSHLYALQPSSQINVRDTPALAQAAKRTLEIRGDDATGWGIGWRINLWARLRDGNHAHDVLKLLLQPARSYPNLFDAHPPFQIDGNFGGANGIMEMVMQSWGGDIWLLPALPSAWPDGSVKGLRARGAASVDLDWRGGAVAEARVTSDKGGTYNVSYGGTRLPLRLRAGETAVLRVENGRLRRSAARRAA